MISRDCSFFLGFIIVRFAGSLSSLESKVNPKGLYTGPYFSPAILSNYTAMVGDTVHLPCQVLQVGQFSTAFQAE